MAPILTAADSVPRTAPAWAAVSVLLSLACGRDAPSPFEAPYGIFRRLYPLRHNTVDILVVVDDSPSMAEEAGTLAREWADFGRILEMLSDLYDPPLDWRLAIVRTSVSSPGCVPSRPDGAFVGESCRARPEDFLRPGSGPDGSFDGPLDLFGPGCAEVCDLDEVPRLPTVTDADPVPRPRPWLERSSCRGNLADGIDVARALSCLGPVGVAGCAFESPLEAMARALRRMEDASAPEYGFRRPGADLFVVFVTDEIDCSFTDAAAAALDLDGERALWSDPNADAPTSAVCWNAGVDCRAGDEPGTYASCVPADRAADGSPAEDPARAVLRPVEDYVDLLTAYRDLQRETEPEADVRVQIVGGWPRDGDLVFADADDAAFGQTFGIGPGCASEHGRGVPPVRLSALAADLLGSDAFEIRPSVCGEGGLEHALSVLAPVLWHRGRQSCLSVALDPEYPLATFGGRPVCRLDRIHLGEHGPERIEVPPCVLTCDGRPCPDDQADLADGIDPPSGAELCVAWGTDPGWSTPTRFDDMSDPCVDAGAQLEFHLHGPDCPVHPSPVALEVTCHTWVNPYDVEP